MDDLREAGVQVLTMGQYLRPTPQHLPVVEYVHPDTFKLYKEIAEKKGFEHVARVPWCVARITPPISIRWGAGRRTEPPTPTSDNQHPISDSVPNKER